MQTDWKNNGCNIRNARLVIREVTVRSFVKTFEFQLSKNKSCVGTWKSYNFQAFKEQKTYIPFSFDLTIHYWIYCT